MAPDTSETEIRHPVRTKISTFEGGYVDDLWMDIELVYNTQDPYAVAYDFGMDPVEGERRVWKFARCLLDSGREHPSGELDVHIFPSTERLVSTILRSHEGEVIVIMDRWYIDFFLEKTYTSVPKGQEFVGVDELTDTIEEILTEAE